MNNLRISLENYLFTERMENHLKQITTFFLTKISKKNKNKNKTNKQTNKHTHKKTKNKKSLNIFSCILIEMD